MPNSLIIPLQNKLGEPNKNESMAVEARQASPAPSPLPLYLTYEEMSVVAIHAMHDGRAMHGLHLHNYGVAKITAGAAVAAYFWLCSCGDFP